MNVVFLHGYKSPHYNEKNIYLESKFDRVWAPKMDYDDPDLFDRILAGILLRDPDLIIGSSMGGWFAHALCTLTNKGGLLFNPAFHSRPTDVSEVKLGTYNPHITVVFGSDDSVIEPNRTLEIMKSGGFKYDYYFQNELGHRIDIDTFTHWVEFVSDMDSKKYPISESVQSTISNWKDIKMTDISSKIINDVYHLYKITYSKNDLDITTHSPEEMKSNYSGVLVNYEGDNLLAYITYKETPFGNKISNLSSNGMRECSRELVRYLLELLNSNGFWFIEASKKIEDILRTNGVNYIEDESIIKSIIGVKKDPNMIEGGYYMRKLKGIDKYIIKRIYGNVKTF
jgi:hypothetical protein